MKTSELLDFIGEIDDELILNAKNNQKNKTKRHTAVKLKVFAGIAAACVLFLAISIFLTNYLFNNVNYGDGGVTGGLDKITSEVIESSEEILILKDKYPIFYVEGDRILSVDVELNYDPNDIFEEWKRRNNIGSDVSLISVCIESSDTTSTYEYKGESVAEHTVGDNYILNITVSKNIQKYYGKDDSGLLLESLKRTMLADSDMNIDEYNLILK